MGLFDNNNASKNIAGHDPSDATVAAFGLTAVGSSTQSAIEWSKAGGVSGKFGDPEGPATMDDFMKGVMVEKLGDIANEPEGDLYVQANTTQEVMRSYVKALKDAASQLFTKGNHTILYNGGTYGDIGLGRTCLTDIITAAKEQDLNTLFEDNGLQDFSGGAYGYNGNSAKFLAANGNWDYNTSMAQYSSTLTPAALIETVKRLASSEVAPMRLFYAAKAMVDYLDDTSRDLSRSAAVLRGAKSNKNIVHRGIKVTEPSKEETALVNLASTKNGRTLIKHMSDRQLDICRGRLDALESATDENGYIINEMSLTTVKALKMFLDSKKNVTKGKMLFFGLPAGKLENLINATNMIRIINTGYDADTFTPAIGPALNNRSLKLKFYMRDHMDESVGHTPKAFYFPLDVTISHAGIAKAFEGSEPPTTFSQLVKFSEFEIHSPLTIGKQFFTGNDLLLKYKMHQLKSVVSSFLLKVFAKLTLKHNLLEEELIDIATDGRQTTSKQAMTLAAQVFGISKNDIGKVFETSKVGLKDILIEPGTKNLKKINQWYDELSFLDADSLLKVFNTKPFFAGDVQNMVSRPSLFDYVFGIFVNEDEFATIHNQDTKRLVEIKTLHCEAELVKESYAANAVDDAMDSA